MSAFVVNPEHIKELAVFAAEKSYCGKVRVDPRYLSCHVSDGLKEQLKGYLLDTDLATIYAGVLYSENIRSVFARYPDCDTIQDLPGLIEKPEYIEVTTTDIVYRKVRNPVHILKMCKCLEYQSCETDDWRETDAYQLLQAIKEAAIVSLPGYKDAPWDYVKVTA